MVEMIRVKLLIFWKWAIVSPLSIVVTLANLACWLETTGVSTLQLYCCYGASWPLHYNSTLSISCCTLNNGRKGRGLWRVLGIKRQFYLFYAKCKPNMDGLLLACGTPAREGILLACGDTGQGGDLLLACGDTG
jgi:hypothetical protein